MNTAVLMVWRMGPKYGLQESSRDPSPGSRRPTVSGRVAVNRRGGRSLWFIHVKSMEGVPAVIGRRGRNASGSLARVHGRVAAGTLCAVALAEHEQGAAGEQHRQGAAGKA